MCFNVLFIFLAGYTHRSQPSSIDLNAVRLCFQVFLEGPQKGKFTTPVKPVVSDPIYDKKSMSDLVITKLSHCNALCNGGQEMILLCEKVCSFVVSIIDLILTWTSHAGCKGRHFDSLLRRSDRWMGGDWRFSAFSSAQGKNCKFIFFELFLNFPKSFFNYSKLQSVSAHQRIKTKTFQSQ